LFLSEWCGAGATAGALHAPVRHCRVMWLVIGLMAASTPVCLYFFRPWLYSADVRARLRKARTAAVVAADGRLPEIIVVNEL